MLGSNLFNTFSEVLATKQLLLRFAGRDATPAWTNPKSPPTPEGGGKVKELGKILIFGNVPPSGVGGLLSSVLRSFSFVTFLLDKQKKSKRRVLFQELM
ncbi:MAG: hypothetical protein H7Y04_04140 [Verrucomicrobia bacterium]|nr:hypothetical protein [Cytophagales bacterium]